MIILEHAVLPDGTLVRLEDWSIDFPFFPYGAMIAAYPRKRMRVRAEAEFETYTEAKEVYDKLTKGALAITDIDFTVMKRGGNRAPLKPLLEKYNRSEE